MTDNLAITSDEINRAVAALKKLRPSYTDLLDFYEQIFMAQEYSESRTETDPITINKELLAVKANEKFPLINISEFTIDKTAFKTLLKNICRITERANQEMAGSAKAIREAVDTAALDADMLYVGLLEEDDGFFNKTAGKLKIENKVLAFVVYNSIKPSLTQCARKLAPYLDEDEPWDKGYCPICGSAAGLSMFENEGKRFLFCGFCWHKWFAERIYCPFCDNRDSNTLHYYFSETEMNYRVDVCDNCRKYIKAVDDRKTDRIIYPPLEFVSTLHLDIKAQEMGFESGIPLNLQV